MNDQEEKNNSKTANAPTSVVELAERMATSHAEAINKAIDARLKEALKPYKDLAERVKKLEEGKVIKDSVDAADIEKIIKDHLTSYRTSLTGETSD